MLRVYTTLLLLFVFGSCTNKEVITIRIEPDKIILNNKHIEKGKLARELELTIEEKIAHGLQKSDLIIYVSASRNTPTIEMGRIERTVRRTGLSREYFWTD